MTRSSRALRAALLQSNLKSNFYLLTKLDQYHFVIELVIERQMKHRYGWIDGWCFCRSRSGVIGFGLFWLALMAFSFYVVDSRQCLKTYLHLHHLTPVLLPPCFLQFRRLRSSVHVVYSLGRSIIATNSYECTHRALIQYPLLLIQPHESIHSPN